MRRTLLFAVIILMTLSCNKSTTGEEKLPFSALGEITSYNDHQMMMKTDQNLDITFVGVNSYELMLEAGRRIYAIGSLAASTDGSYQASLHGLSFITINKVYLYEDIKDDDTWRDNLGNKSANIAQGVVSGNYLTLFTESKSDYLSLVITNTNVSNTDVINIDAELCNNTSVAGGGPITSFDISEYLKHSSGLINIKYKSGNSSATEYTVSWNKK